MVTEVTHVEFEITEVEVEVTEIEIIEYTCEVLWTLADRETPVPVQ